MGPKKERTPKDEYARCMTRLVGKGYSQKEGVDFNEVFSSVVKHSSICTFLTKVALFHLELEQLNVKITFLHGKLKEKLLRGRKIIFAY